MRIKLRGKFKKRDWRKVRTSLERGIPRLGKRVQAFGEKITAKWDNEIQFKTTTRLTKGNIVTNSRPVGKNAVIWGYVSNGTKPHIIRARPGSSLAFKTNYKPHTMPGGKFFGQGKATGKVVFAKKVNHPGSAPRRLERHWIIWIRKWYPQAVQELINEGLKKS